MGSILVVLLIIFLFVRAYEVIKKGKDDAEIFEEANRKTNIALELQTIEKYLLAGNDLDKAFVLMCKDVCEQGFDCPQIPRREYRAGGVSEIEVAMLDDVNMSDDELGEFGEGAQIAYNNARDKVNQCFYCLPEVQRTVKNECFRVENDLSLKADIPESFVEEHCTSMKKLAPYVYLSSARLHWDSPIIHARISAFKKLYKNHKIKSTEYNEFVYGRPLPKNKWELDKEIDAMSTLGTSIANIGDIIKHKKHGACLVETMSASQKGGLYDSYFCKRLSDGEYVFIKMSDKNII